MDDEDKEQSSVKEEHMTDSGRVDESGASCSDPTGGVGDSIDHTTVCKDAVTMEVIMEEDNDLNRTLGCDREHEAVEPVSEECNTPARVHQLMELSEDVGTKQQEPVECVQDDIGSGDVDNVKKVQ